MFYGNNNFTIKTENQSVAIILSKNSKPKPTTSLRILSWISKITGYNYKIEHITGTSNIADYVSRCHNSAKTIEFDDLKTMYTLQSINTQTELKLKDIIIEPSVVSLEEIIHESSKDENIK